VQIDLGQLYNINSIKVKSTTGANNIANNPDATNDLVIFTSETSMETSPSISELRNQSNVNEIGITSGINYFNREQKFSTSNVVVKDIIIDNAILPSTISAGNQVLCGLIFPKFTVLFRATLIPSTIISTSPI
jgi:hypothetical protein